MLRKPCVFRGTTFDEFKASIGNGLDGRIFYLLPGKVTDSPRDAIFSSFQSAEQSGKPPCVICIPSEYFSPAGYPINAPYVSSPSFRVFSTLTSLENLLGFAAGCMTDRVRERLKRIYPENEDPVHAYFNNIRQQVQFYFERLDRQEGTAKDQ